jgi:hypothetical protein
MQLAAGSTSVLLATLQCVLYVLLPYLRDTLASPPFSPIRFGTITEVNDTYYVD